MLRVERRRRRAAAVRAADEDQRPVELVHLVEKDVEVQRERLRHAILAVMGGEVVVPLPHVPRERFLAVHLDLLHVQLVAEDLHGRLDEPGVADDARIDLAPQVQAHGRAHRVAVLLAKVLRAALGEEPRQLRPEHLDFGRGEQ